MAFQGPTDSITCISSFIGHISDGDLDTNGFKGIFNSKQLIKGLNFRDFIINSKDNSLL